MKYFKNFKKKISLFLALTMVFGLFAPFATPVTVVANEIPRRLDPEHEGTAAQGELRVSFDAMLTPAPGRPNFHSGLFVAPEGSVMANWDITVPSGIGGEGFLDVLRWFDHDGRRFELTVRQLHAHDNPALGLQVDLDIYIPIRGAGGVVTGYRHINDPLRRLPGPGFGAPGGFHIWMPGINNYVSASSFFNELNGNAGVQDCEHGTRLNRANDRPRFESAVTGSTYTPVRADYLWPMYPILNMNSRSITVPEVIMVPGEVPNPDHDPNDPDSPATVPGYVPYTIYVPYPIFDEDDPLYYTWLSPSFNIGPGRGFSFQFGGNNMHFRWEAAATPGERDQFFFFIEDFLEHGQIYEFVLEHYNNPMDAHRYIVGVPPETPLATGTPAGNRMVGGAGEDWRSPNRSNVVYVFRGIDFSGTALNAIPFAANLHAPGLPNTRRGQLLATQDDIGNLYNMPLADLSPLNLTATPPAVPAQDDLGIDVRFNLPSMHNESLGTFNIPVYEHPLLGERLNVTLRSRVVLGRDTSEDFDVRIPLQGMGGRLHVPGNDDPWAGNAHILPIGPSGDRNDDIALRDVSLLHRVGEENPDRMRIKIGGLNPSIAYQNVRLYLTEAPLPGQEGIILPAMGNFLTNEGRLAGTQDAPFYTFLNMRFDTLMGTQVVIVEPFNLLVNANIDGFYHLQIGTDAPSEIPVSAASTEVYFNLPGGFGFSLQFTVSRSLASIAQGTPPRQFSQDVIWQPVREPAIDIPHSFVILPESIRHRPMQEDALAGHLDFTVQWNIAPFNTLMSLFTYPYGDPSDVLSVSYIIGHSTSPETQALVPGEENVHREYIAINMEIRLDPDEGLQIRYLDSSDFIYPLRHLGDPATPHPIVNRYGCPENGGWLPLERRPDPTRPGGEYIVFTNIDIVTNTARRFRYPPPPDHLRSDFQFPGIYFMNVRLESWGSIENGVYRNRGGYSPWSLFDDIVINDFGVLDPPPPSNLSVEAGPQPPSTAQPFLNVNFYIPAGAILTYLETMYPMETQITTNLYIGQFEEAISEIFFPMPLPPAQQIRQPLSPDLRGTASSVEIAFEDLQPEFIDGRMEIDITDFQALLRGESGGSGVLRITNIPIFYSSLAITDPEPLGTIVNYNVAGSAFPNRYDSFERTYEILNNRQDFPIRLRLTGAEENVAYFLFADMEIEKFVEIDDELVLRPEIPPYQRNPAISDLTGVVSDTTVGTPQAPGPGEIAPSAPQNIGVRDVTQMGATVYWDPYPLTPAEVEDENISIEWEIIRIQDGIRLTDEQMNARDPNFMRVFNSLTTAQGHRKGWITDVDSITVFPDNEVHEEPDEYYEYNRRIVELTDMTLLPNNMYFYYVRTVRIETAWDDQLGDYVLIRNVSVWVEVSVTTSPVEPPTNLRQEDPGNHAGFDPETMVRVSWEHTIMSQIIDGGGETFLFQYQIRESDDSWGEYNVMPVSVMTEAWLDAFNANRIHYIVFGLEHGTVYEMRVRLYDVTSGDRSLWSNTIIFMTDVNQDDAHLEREVEDWLRYLRRRLEELLRNPFWISERTPNNLTVVYRPDAVFEGFMLDNAGTALPLHNTGVNNVVYYLPLSIILTANENRRGFETSFRDMQLLFAPSFLSDAHNQALIDVIREVEARGSSLTDSFARIEIDREVVDPDAAVPSINGVPAITLSTQIRAEMVATNNNIRNIRSWDRTMQINAERIVEDWLSDPVISENIRQQLMNYLSNEEMSDYIYHVVDRVVADIIREAGGFITHDDGGILSDTRFEITGFNASTHVIATPPREEYSVNGYEFINNNWQPRDLVEYHNGRAIITRTPGRFAFTGREIIIPYIEVTPRGGVIVSIVARYSLEDLFGVYVDLEQNANRQMVVGAVSRMAGVPRNANAMNWAVANLNVQLTSRNATGLISRQEAIAIVMALYEHRTNTQVNSIRIHNHQNTAGMNLDQRYAQAVRAAFEIGIISDTSFNPAGHITIGEFLDMLSILSARVRV